MSVVSLPIPQHAVSGRELDDLELLRLGGLGPVTGFGVSVDDSTLVVPVDMSDADRIELTDPEGVPRGVVTVMETYAVADDRVGIVGPFTPSPGPLHHPFADLQVSPTIVRQQCVPDAVLCVVDAPLTVDDLSMLEAQASGSPVVFLVLTGEGSPRHVSAVGLVRTVIEAARRLPNARVVTSPVARRPDPSRDANFRDQVARVYAPGSTIVWAHGTGERDPEIERLVLQDRPAGTKQGLVVFFTGLSGSGKSTIASSLRNRVVESGVRTVSLLDGDRVRRNLSRGLSFSRADRDVNVERIGWVAAEIARHGGMAICSPIAPFDQTRKAVRAMAIADGSAFVLVHVATPLAECERRDRKGLYAQARRGEIPDFTGISSPYEEPHDAELVIDTSTRTINDELNEILGHLVGRGLLPSCDRTVSTTEVGFGDIDE